jgi:hypothetical protein
MTADEFYAAVEQCAAELGACVEDVRSAAVAIEAQLPDEPDRSEKVLQVLRGITS